MGDNRHIKEGTLFMPYLGIFLTGRMNENVHDIGIKNSCVKLEKPYWPIEYIRFARIHRLKIEYKIFLTLIHIANHAKISYMDQTLQ